MLINEIKIRELLFKQRKTQSQLSDEIGVTRNTINAICNGKSCCFKTAHKIADALGVNVEEIMR